MPNIAEYNATGELTPSDKGIQGAEMAGRRIGQFYHQMAGDVSEVADAVKQHMTVMETSELYKTGTELKLGLQQRYEQESALPENRNDPHFGDRFMAEVGSQLDNWSKNASTDHGKLLAAEMKDSIRTDLFHHVAAGQAEMDTAHVEDNMKQTGNLLGAGLITDPSEPNLDRTLGTMKDAIQGATMAIPDTATRERVATELTAQYMPQLVVARYRGVAESAKNQIAQTGGDTSPALEQLNKDMTSQLGFEHLTPEQQAGLATLRDDAVRQGQELFKAKDATQRKAESDAFDAALLPIETSLFKPNSAGGVTMQVTPDALAAVQRAAQMPGAKQHPEKIEALLNAMHTATQDAITGKETVTDRSTYNSLSSMIGSTTNPLTTVEVDKARAQHRLSDSDYSFLRSSAVDSKQGSPKVTHAMTEVNQFLERIKPIIDKSSVYSGIDQQGAVKFSQFAWDVQNKVRQAIASGEDPEKAVARLTDPHNANGFYRFIPQYQTTNKQGLAAVLEETTPNGVQPIPAPPGGVSYAPPPAANPGETPEAYLKRISK